MAAPALPPVPCSQYLTRLPQPNIQNTREKELKELADLTQRVSAGAPLSVKHRADYVRSYMNFSERWGYTPLHVAIVNNDPDLLRRLGGQIVRIDPSLLDVGDAVAQTPLYWSARENSSRLAECLLQLGAKTNIAACRTGSLLEISLSRTPLHRALHLSNPECAKTLLRHGAEIYKEPAGWEAEILQIAKDSLAKESAMKNALVVHPKLHQVPNDVLNIAAQYAVPRVDMRLGVAIES